MRLGFTAARGSMISAVLAFGLLILAPLSCTQYKPSSYRSQIGNTNSAVSSGNSTNNGPVTLTDTSVVLANTKLAALGGTLTAKISFGGQTVTQDFSPSGTQTELKGLQLPSGASALMTVEILQGQTVKFVAKRANTTIQAGGKVVVDDCLILRAPWVGTTNEGSCEWNITEM